jgi:hypothetical protein
MWESPRGFTIVPVHYSADPEKRDPEYVAQERAKYTHPEEFAREMEIDFSALAGTPCYPKYQRSIHYVTGMRPRGEFPLRLDVDFNVQPMIWIVAQYWGNKHRALKQLKIATNASVTDMVSLFRSEFPSHGHEVWVFPDATGRARDAQTGKSDLALLELAFRGYPSRVLMKGPIMNPKVKDRVNAVNRMLIGQDGEVRHLVNGDECPDLILDYEQVVWQENLKDIKKIYDPIHPYAQRTHASDAVGYDISYDFPVRGELLENVVTKRKRDRKYGRLIGQME